MPAALTTTFLAASAILAAINDYAAGVALGFALANQIGVEIARTAGGDDGLG